MNITIAPDEADEVDAGDVVEGLIDEGLASASSSASGWRWFLAVRVQWLDVRKQGGRVAVSVNFVLKWLIWTMHCNYTVLKKNR